MPDSANPTFGWELILDLYECNPVKVREREAIVNFVAQLCDQALGMKRYGEPWAERFGLDKPQTAGYTVAQLIETSSVVAHFSELKSAVYFEVFSCKPFDSTAVEEFCQRYFEAQRVSKHFLIRE